VEWISTEIWFYQRIFEFHRSVQRQFEVACGFSFWTFPTHKLGSLGKVTYKQYLSRKRLRNHSDDDRTRKLKNSNLELCRWKEARLFLISLQTSKDQSWLFKAFLKEENPKDLHIEMILILKSLSSTDLQKNTIHFSIRAFLERMSPGHFLGHKLTFSGLHTNSSNLLQFLLPTWFGKKSLKNFKLKARAIISIRNLKRNIHIWKFEIELRIKLSK